MMCGIVRQACRLRWPLKRSSIALLVAKLRETPRRGRDILKDDFSENFQGHGHLF
ncbi:hypothetical protein Y600_6275 [Burkholderia pseudomallei MSHR3709]|nr:hypothetical protein DO63_1541 [Burkholderia pseudomallei]KGX48431.1 hypothetical protein Y600_6275 [Burkholderia pseudomallei MSHR3709]